MRGCGEKTHAALLLIVESGDTFFLPELERAEVKPGALRGVWTGLTKRVPTITGDDNAKLIEWSETDADEWNGRLMPVTREALRRARAE